MLSAIMTFLLLGAVLGLIGWIISVAFKRLRKKTAKIILHILIIGPYIYTIWEQSNFNGYTVWQCILAALIAYIPVYLFDYWLMKRVAHVCPHCGEWNCDSVIEVLSEDTYHQRVDVQRAIRNADGEKIGSFDDSEIHTISERFCRIKCDACGHVYEELRKYDLSE